MNVLQPIRQAHFRQQPWANGGGTTTELSAGPDREAWDWRLSIASVDGDSTFSTLPGVTRHLAPLDGALKLAFGNSEPQTLARLQVTTFAGDQQVTCRLPDGPGRALNLMLRPGCSGELLARPLAGTMLVPPGALWLLVLLTGRADITSGGEHQAMDTGTVLHVRPANGQRVLIEGAGEIALARVDQT